MLDQLNIVVSNMAATLEFYRKLGLDFGVDHDAAHASVALPNGLLLEFDSTKFVPKWDSGWKGSVGGSTVLGFSLASREAVDAVYADLTASGHRGRQQPYEAFWGARYAIVEDPDGNPVGLMSPVDVARKFWPPSFDRQAPSKGDAHGS